MSWSDRENVVGFVTALESVADKIESKSVYYSWPETASCNCGLVAQELLGLRNSAELDSAFGYAHGSWTSLRMAFDKLPKCDVTGWKMADVFQELEKQGFRGSDFSELEHLSNAEIIAEAGLKLDLTRYWTEPDNVVKYLRAWARLIRKDYCAKMKGSNGQEALVPSESQESGEIHQDA